MFQDPQGAKYEELTSVCGWNKSWVPEVSDDDSVIVKSSCDASQVFDPCVATSCQYIPFPPSDLDMVYVPDDQNSLSLLSELSIYNPRLPFSMKFPGAQFCQDNGEILMIVGEISKKKSKKPLEIVFAREGTEVNTKDYSMKVRM